MFSLDICFEVLSKRILVLSKVAKYKTTQGNKVNISNINNSTNDNFTYNIFNKTFIKKDQIYLFLLIF